MNTTGNFIIEIFAADAKEHIISFRIREDGSNCSSTEHYIEGRVFGDGGITFDYTNGIGIDFRDLKPLYKDLKFLSQLVRSWA